MKATGAVLILTVVIACVSASAFAQQRLVKIAGDPYPPWTIGEAGSKPAGGIAVQIAEQLFSRLGMRTDVFVYPFKRGLERIKHGEDDAILMVSRSPEREQYMLFSAPIRDVKFVFYYSAESDDIDWSDWKDLQSLRIGSVTGYNIGDDWKSAIVQYNLQVEEVKTDIFNVEKLLAGRIDMFVTDHEVMQRIIAKNPLYHGKLKWNPKPVFESVNNIGVSKKSFLAPMLPGINKELQAMKQDGAFQRIFCAHGKSYQGSCDSN